MKEVPHWCFRCLPLHAYSHDFPSGNNVHGSLRIRYLLSTSAHGKARWMTLCWRFGKTGSGPGKIRQSSLLGQLAVVILCETNDEFLELAIVSTPLPVTDTSPMRAKIKTMKTKRLCVPQNPTVQRRKCFKGLVEEGFVLCDDSQSLAMLEWWSYRAAPVYTAAKYDVWGEKHEWYFWVTACRVCWHIWLGK